MENNSKTGNQWLDMKVHKDTIMDKDAIKEADKEAIKEEDTLNTSQMFSHRNNLKSLKNQFTLTIMLLNNLPQEVSQFKIPPQRSDLIMSQKIYRRKTCLIQDNQVNHYTIKLCNLTKISNHST